MSDGWIWFQLGLATLVALTFGVIFEGAPYVPTKRREIQDALKLAKLKKGQTIVDLGSGDGRFLAAAADKGYRAVGYELSPILSLISRLRLRKYGDKILVRNANFWHQELPEDTSAVFVFLAGPFMKRLAGHLEKEAARLDKPITLISYGFDLPGHLPDAQDGAVKRFIVKPPRA